MSINATSTLLQILGGAALLLWGLRMVRTGVTRGFGSELRRVIGAGMSNPVYAMLAGLAVTLLLQSSTATALMVSSFAGKGFLSAASALGAMLGADLGTSLVAQILSLKLAWLWSLLVLAGVITFFAGGESRAHDVGRVLIGIGLMLLALATILAGSEPLQHSDAIGIALNGLRDDVLIGLLLAALLTLFAHSSLAIVVLVMAMAGAGVIGTTFSLALVLGANLGGGMLPIIATWRSEPAARRAPLGNGLFRLLGVVLALPVLVPATEWLSRLDPDPARLVVNFHTAVNLALCVGGLGLTRLMARLCARMLPEKPVEDDPGQPRHLDASALAMPAVALAYSARETLRMADTLELMLARTITVLEADDRRLLSEIERQDDIVDSLHEAIKLYLTRLSGETMDDDQRARCIETIAFTTNLEHIGDIIDKNLMELAAKKIKRQLRFSVEGAAEIRAMHTRLVDNLRLAMGVFMSADLNTARRLLQEKERFRDMERTAAENHFRRLRAGRLESLESSALHLDIIRDFKRINSHITSVAYPILEQAGELRASRLKSKARRAATANAAAKVPKDETAAPGGGPVESAG